MPDEDFKVEGIKGVSKAIKKSSPADLDASRIQANRERFDAAMDKNIEVKAPPKVESSIEVTDKPSLMEEIRRLSSKVDAISQATPETIRAQAKDLIAQIDAINGKFSQHAQMAIKPSYQALLKNRLSHIDDILKVALSKAGLEHTPAFAADTGPNPIEKFLGYLSHGQNQLENIGKSIAAARSEGIEMDPGDMLLIQVKMHQVQQELEFFTNLLNKVLESAKTLMNVQV